MTCDVTVWEPQSIFQANPQLISKDSGVIEKAPSSLIKSMKETGRQSHSRAGQQAQDFFCHCTRNIKLLILWFDQDPQTTWGQTGLKKELGGRNIGNPSFYRYASSQKELGKFLRACFVKVHGSEITQDLPL